MESTPFEIQNLGNKKRKISPSTDPNFAFFDELPDDLVVEIVSKLGASASCPSDFFSLLLTCKRMNGLGFNRTVVSKVSPRVFTAQAKNWGPKAFKLMKSCFFAWNVEAVYTLGVIWFYCNESNRELGKAIIAKAASKSHPAAIYSHSVILFNGSGATARDLASAVKVVTEAALLGHVNAVRELAYCLQDGYGIERDPLEGRRLLLQARALEIASLPLPVPRPTSTNSSATTEMDKLPIPVPKSTWLASDKWVKWLPRYVVDAWYPINESGVRQDLGTNLPPPEPHPANRFLTEWFEIRGGVSGGRRLCSHRGCGRPETRVNEFRRCSVCNAVCYCSRACQNMDWHRRHQSECKPAVNVDNAVVNVNNAAGDVDVDVDVDGEENEEEVIAVDGIQEEQVVGEEGIGDEGDSEE